jgi:hypothetical protein
MTATTTSATGARTASSLSTTIAVGCVLATLGSVVYISGNDLEPREAFAHPLSVASGVVTSIGILLLSLGLMRWRTALPGWAVLASAAGLGVAGATAWAQSTVLVAAAVGTDDALFRDLFFDNPWVLGSLAPKSVLCFVGFLALAYSGWRTRAIPRPAAVAFGLAGVLSLWPPYPPGLIVASLALFLVARAGMEIRT